MNVAVNKNVWRQYADQRLPRYTSYPTAAQFHPGISAADYRAWIAQLAPEARVSLYLHIPFCRSLCTYCGCHTTITQRVDPIERYLRALHREIETVADMAHGRRVAGHIHFGGGTPTIIDPEAFRALFALLSNRFRIDAQTEVAIEIDPRTLTTEMADTLGEVGVTRASIGVQTFDQAVQAAINRIQSFAQTEAAISSLRRAGVKAINLDVIYGLPAQTVRSCIETIETCLALRPDRFAIFGYAHVPSFKKHQQVIDERQLPDAAARYEQATAIGDALVAAGYRRIGLDHFALADDEMARAAQEGTLRRNFQGYTTDTCEALLGFGASAIGQLPQGYVQNEVSIRTYCDRVAQEGIATVKGYRLNADDRLRADLIERLMCDLEVDVADVCARHGAACETLSDTWPQFQRLAGDGIVSIDRRRVRVPESSRLLLRFAAAAFDAHLAAAARTFSRAV
jgi:oxygen-independent coproporphyrinogen-3 oxidase